jgi:hypothetical protein
MTTTETIQIGELVEHRGVVVAPLFPRRQPRTRYLTLDEALPLGFRVTEVSAQGSVPELLATNPTDETVLLYDGEELLGAKQNRILNITVLVAPQSEFRIPVSCVEQGRWAPRSTYLSGAAHAAYPELRRRKAERLLAAPLRRGVAQEAVWDSVAEKSVSLGAFSPTGAQADIYAAREKDVAGLRRAFPLEPGQSGALVAFGPERLCLDYLSRPEAFARLYPKLLDGYPARRDRAPRRRARRLGAPGGLRRRGLCGPAPAGALSGPRRGRAPLRAGRPRLGARAGRRGRPALGLHDPIAAATAILRRALPAATMPGCSGDGPSRR